MLKTNVFSIIIDETTDVSVQKKLAVVVQLYDFKTSRLDVELLDLVDCADGSAVNLSQTVLQLFKNMNIDTKMFIGFSVDTCNAMFGAKNSVSVYLKKAVPHLASIKCSSHSMHLTSI